MRTFACLGTILTLAACSSRPQHPNPYIPPETQYSAGSTIVAAGGVIGAAVGSELMDSRRSPRTRAIGAGAVASGMALMAIALIDAIEVEKQREKVINIDRAMRHLYTKPGVPDSFFRPPPPPIPEAPFEFPDKDPPPEP